MAFLIYNTTGTAVPIDDLGLEVPANASYDLITDSPYDVSISSDLANAITTGNIVVLDPRVSNPTFPTNQLSAQLSQIVVDSHNNPHFGILGAVINDLDDVNMSGASGNDVLQFIGGTLIPTSPSALAADIALGDLSDVVDGITPKPITDFYVLVGDGSNGTILTDAKTDNAVFIPFIEDTVGNVFTGGTSTDITFTYNPATNKVDVAVDDSYLRNTGDTLDSGTLNIASGASLVVATGATATVVDAPTNPNDITNKAYVDSVAQGTDNKDSVHVATTPSGGDLGGTYTSTGSSGAPGSGTITNIPSTIIDGVDLLNHPIGERIIVKDQIDPRQNGIYVLVSVSASPLSMDIQRSPDHDGTPVFEVSPGNLAFVEEGNANANTSWIVTGIIDPIVLNTDPVNWTQFSGAGAYTAGAGLGLNGTQFFLDTGNLTSITVDPLDEIAFNDVSDVALDNDKKRTFASLILDLGLYTNSSLTASDGVLITGGDIQMDITGLSTLATPTLNAEMVFDAGGTGTHNKGTVANFFNSLDVVHGITSDGILVRTTNDIYESRSIIPSILPGEEGISIVNGDGILGNPSVGIDISTTTTSSTNISSTDLILMYNGSNNVAVSGTQIANGVSALLGGIGNAYTNIIGDSGSAAATTSSDTLNFVGGANGGITTLVTDATPDRVEFTVDFNALAPRLTSVTGSMLLGIGEGTTLPTTTRSIDGVLADLGVPSGIDNITGILVSNGAGVYTGTALAVQGIGSDNGISVINANGVSGNPTIGLDVVGLPQTAAMLEPSDIFVVNHTAGSGNNESITGQNVAAGVANIMGLGGVAISTINGQEILTLVDTTRSNKILSTSETEFTWSENRLNNNDWISIGGARDARTGHIMPLNGTIVRITAHTSDDNNVAKVVNLYVDGTLTGAVGNFPGSGGESTIVDSTVNVDFIQGSKLRLRAGTGGAIEDTTISMFVKWRA